MLHFSHSLYFCVSNLQIKFWNFLRKYKPCLSVNYKSNCDHKIILERQLSSASIFSKVGHLSLKNSQVLEIILSKLQLIGIALFTKSLSASAVPMWLKRFSKNININLLLFLRLQPFCVLLSTIFNMAPSSRLDLFYPPAVSLTTSGQSIQLTTML